MHYFINGITKHYADFSGRARRKEFWVFTLFSVATGFMAQVIDGILGTTSGQALGVLGILVPLALFLPGLAVTIRRLHDVGKSGWFYLIFLIPLVGSIWLLVLFCTDGQRGFNAYGPNPKATPAGVATTSGFCGSCGTPRVVGSAFCGKCGAALA